MTTLRYDEDASRRLVAIYVTPDVAAQRAELLRALQPRAGERVLDVGSGPGFLVESLADELGESGFVAGVDISEPLLDYARTHCAHADRIEYRHGDATALPYPAASFDAVVCSQVLEYIDDVDTAIAELHRVLRPGGRVAIMDTDWDSIVWHSDDRARMKRILATWEAHAPHPRLPRTLAGRLRRAGLVIGQQRVMPLFNPEYADDSYSNRIADLIAAFVVGRGVSSDEASAWARDLRDAGRQQRYFFSLNRYLFVATRPLAGQTEVASAPAR